MLFPSFDGMCVDRFTLMCILLNFPQAESVHTPVAHVCICDMSYVLTNYQSSHPVGHVFGHVTQAVQW